MTAPAALLHLLLLAASSQSTYDGEIAAAVLDVERIHYVPPALVKAIIHCESDFNARAVSRAGAIGLMQVMPFNAERTGITQDDLWTPSKNILAGVRLLAVLLKHYQGDLISALAAYNSRPRPLYTPLPKNGETPRYVAAVLRQFAAYSPSSASGGGKSGLARIIADLTLSRSVKPYGRNHGQRRP